LNLKQTITDIIARAVAAAEAAGKLPTVTLPEIVIERPQNPDHGDYASSIALKLARAVGRSPLEIAAEIAAFAGTSEEIGSVEVAPPGFINFTLKDSWLASQVSDVLAAGDGFGEVEYGAGKRVQVEFVSVNPTGPLHVGHGRGAILGSTLANVLGAAGYEVEKEYYVNDAGNQVSTFRRSLLARYKQAIGEEAEIPADGYVGEYVADIAKDIIAAEGDRLAKLDEAALEKELGRIGLERMLDWIKDDLAALEVSFDVWFSEQSLYDNGQYRTTMDLLKKGGYLAEREGATWFASTALGEDKDNVIIRTDGTPTYFATDIAYHYNKFIERKFDRVIDIWGADHLGHVSRMKAVCQALGIDPEALTVIISQMVTLKRGGEVVKISKRSGDLITLRELVDEVGADACRFNFLSRTADSQMDFDLELAVKQSADNPVYYVQYAHARIASILRHAEEKGADDEGGDVSLLTADAELALIRKMLLLPEIVESIAASLEPHALPYYAQELATAFHAFYKQCRVVTNDRAMTAARLKLVKAAKVVLGRTLRLMGMNAPEKM
jgi:arginyl-tRNA synthetase